MSDEIIRKSGCGREDYREYLLSDNDPNRFGFLHAWLFLDEGKIFGGGFPLAVGFFAAVVASDDLGWLLAVLIGVVLAAAIYGLMFLAMGLAPEDQLQAGCDGLHCAKKPAWSLKLNYVFIPWSRVVKVDLTRGFEILYSDGSNGTGKIETDLKIQQKDLEWVSNNLLVAKHDGKIPGSIVIEACKPVPEKKSTLWPIVKYSMIAWFVWMGVQWNAEDNLQTEYIHVLHDAGSSNQSNPVAGCLAKATVSANGWMDLLSYDLGRLPREGLKSPPVAEVSKCMKPSKQAVAGQP